MDGNSSMFGDIEGKTQKLMDFDTSSSSSSDFSFVEQDNCKKRKICLRVKNYVENIVREYTEVEFKADFRMSRSTAYKIINMFEETSVIPQHTTGREKITAEKAFLLSVWYLSNQESFRQVSSRFDVTYSSAHRCLIRTVNFLLSIKSDVIRWPSLEEMETISANFEKIGGIKKVIGCIDGTHIEINKPRLNQDSYINRKGYHSLLMQGVVNNKKKFIDVFCGEPGSMHDARLLRKSGIYRTILNNANVMKNYIILGDSAYPNLDWLVTPFKDNGKLSVRQKEFNKKISATRVIVENSFGLLKCRFRRLKKWKTSM
ncbi:hypothetical protein PPYR_07987 [Photinus pyralis]|uniref:DDE Tnp4 domain-containing protein n=1 Tax=Photinus pyralis TaxID=7054 RepID=A0A5N4AS00_PHOPY|nr:hypothetical protein PPYR_07987 [Photinus pyralis]